MSNETGGMVGRVLGTQDSTPLQFWVGLQEGSFLQLDDIVVTERTPPGSEPISIYGVVTQVIARHEGARFDSDVFLIEEGVLPGDLIETAEVTSTRVEPELFVPPLPGAEVRKAEGKERDQALFFDNMTKKLPAGLTRDDEPLFINLEFLDGTRGAHVNISGISGVATKTTYATFLLYSLFNSGALGADAINTKALIFNVKGEDLLFLDHRNIQLSADDERRYGHLGLTPGPFASTSFFAPPRVGDRNAVPDVSTRSEGVTSFFWTLEEFCTEELLPFVFADAEDDRQHYTMVVHNVAAKLRDVTPLRDGGVQIDGAEVRTFRALAELIAKKVQEEDWAGPVIGAGTINAFVRRLLAAIKPLERLIRGDIPNAGKHRVALDKQVTVVDIHNLPDRAKRFVVGVVLRRTLDEKERTGQARPLLFLVLDELNKYAPRDGTSPIKEILLDVAERGRSLGMILIGAQQTASEVEGRIVGQSAIRVVGRLDSAEADKGQYGFLRGNHRDRATIMKPGTMMMSQPEIPVPLVLEFPFPAWASRPSEAGSNPAAIEQPEDPFEGLPKL
ncbi:MAG TPA: ATP-binding protein [Actinomycetota bacterium]|nr:ATP-binding protein [Actinomycetota bacterium]